MQADPGILTTLLSSFMAVFTAGSGNITMDATRFLYLVSGIELTGAAIFWALRGDNAIVPLIQKIMVIGVFAWFVLNWPQFLNWMAQGFIELGFKAGAGGASIANFNDPSSIILQGFTTVDPIAKKLETLTWMDVGPIIIYGLSMLLTLFAFAVIGIQVFLTYLEFYLLATLALALVPFGVIRWTSFMSEKAFGLVFSFGVKLMVLAFIVSAAQPVLANLIIPANPDYNQCLSVLIGAGAIAFLTWHAPGIASGLVSGGPSLSASVAARTAASAVVAGVAGIGAGAAGVSGAANLGRSAVTAAASTAGALTAGAEFGAATAAMGGGGTIGQVVGATRGVAGVVSGAATSPVGAVTQTLKDAWVSGKIKGFQNVGLPANATSTYDPKPSASATRVGSAHRSSTIDNMIKTSHVIPPDASPSGGASPNINS